jgi:hypothetical protein
MSIPPECQSIENRIARVHGEVQQALQQLEATAPSERPTRFQQLKALTAKLHDLQDSLGACIVNSRQVEGLFRGTGTIMIEQQQPSSDISFSTLLNSERSNFTLTSFPPISYTFHTPQGNMMLTVTKTSGGSGSYANGHIVLPLGLHFALSGPPTSPLDSPLDADLSTTLTTNPPGSPVTPEPLGAVTLVGSGILQGGFVLNGQKCDVTISGKISPAA